MKYRQFGRIGWKVSEISFGAWAVGGSWGAVDDEQSIDAMKRALDVGVNFFDTADVYGDGRSERLIQRLRKETKAPFYVATKAGRRLDPHTASGVVAVGFVVAHPAPNEILVCSKHGRARVQGRHRLPDPGVHRRGVSAGELHRRGQERQRGRHRMAGFWLKSRPMGGGCITRSRPTKGGFGACRWGAGTKSG